MSEDAARRLDMSIVQTAEDCVAAAVDDLLRRLATHPSSAVLLPRRQALVERTTSALLRIIADEWQPPVE